MRRTEVLTVLHGELLLELEPTLLGYGAAVRRARNLTIASAFAHTTRYDVLLLSDPLPGMTLKELLQDLRSPASASRSSSVIVVTRRTPEGGILGDDRGDFLTISLADSLDPLKAALAVAVGAAARQKLRLLVEVKTDASGGGRSLLQTRDISKAGIFLRTSEPLPHGALGQEVGGLRKAVF